MTMLADVQRVLLRAMLADDPVAALGDSIAQEGDLSDDERAALRKISREGLVMTSLLVKKLRFERLAHGEADLEKLFEREPKAFLRLYQNYTGAVPPTAYFPQEEADLFRQWQKQQSE